MKKNVAENVLQYVPGIVAFLSIVLLDQTLKAFIASRDAAYRLELIPRVFWLSRVENTGTSFGLFQNSNVLFVWIAIAIFGILLFLHNRFTTKNERFAYWLLLAGLVGNAIDRIARGTVIDLFDLGWFPVFNIADAAITSAVLLLLADELLRSRAERV